MPAEIYGEKNIEPDREQPFRVDTRYFSVSSQPGSFAGIYLKLGILARSDREHQIGPSQPSDKSKSVIILDLVWRVQRSRMRQNCRYEV